ncbi:MAG: D-amino acid dehydrogenase, partial [Salaquimonas sp.]
FTPGAPLLVNPTPSWHKLSWMAEFVAAIPKHEQNTVTTVRLALAARDHLRQMAKDEGIDFDCEDRGILHFYKTKAEFEDGARATKLLAQGGLHRDAVTPEEIRKIEPALKGEIYGGFYTPSDFTGDIHKFTNGLAKASIKRGVMMRLGHEISDLKIGSEGVVVTSRRIEGEQKHEHQMEVFDKIVICSGVYSRKFGQMLGDRVNIYPVKGYSITVQLPEASDRKAAPWTSLLDDTAKIVTSRLGKDRFRVAGTAEFNGYNRDISWSRIEPLVNWCREHFPEMSTRNCVPWAGLRPMMPDMLPRVQQGKNQRVFYNTGHGHLGWTLSAATADQVATLMSDKVTV